MKTPRFLLAVLGAVLIFVPVALVAQQAGTEEDPVVARVDGEEIRQSDVLELARGLPPQYQAQLTQIFPLLVQRAVDFKLAGKAGRAAGLADDTEVKSRLAEAEERAIREVFLEREIEERISDESLRQRYDKFLADNPAQDEQRARHFLLESEEAAREIIAELDKGADFAELAKTRSTGPSAPQGGDLGYFTAEQMVPEFAEAAAKLEPGEYTKAPTQTQFGWHVIKLEDRRPVEPPSYEEVEPELREEASRDAFQAVLADLRANASVEVLPAGEAPLGEDAAPAPAPAQ